jgi:hypothetical protein
MADFTALPVFGGVRNWHLNRCPGALLPKFLVQHDKTPTLPSERHDGNSKQRPEK